MIFIGSHEGDDWHPRMAWPERTRLKWGDSGVVLDRFDSQSMSFFEAYLPDSEESTQFVRAEGCCFEEAEERAFAQFNRTAVF